MPSETDEWPPKVLISRANGRSTGRVYHYPIAPGTYTPRCVRVREDVSDRTYYRRDRDRYAEAYSLCSFCDPSSDVERTGGDKETWQKLARVGDYSESGADSTEAEAFRDRINAALKDSQQSQEGDA